MASLPDREFTGVPRKRIWLENNMDDGPLDLTVHLRAKRSPAIDEPAKKYHCRTCNYSSKRSGNVTRHEESVHCKKTIECCGNKFPTKFDYDKHRKLMNHDKNGFNCDTCDRNFKRSSLLARHKLTHTGEKGFKCDLGKCKYASNSKSNLLRHQQSSRHQKNDSFSTRKKKASCNAADDLTHPQDRVFDILTPTAASRSPFLFSTPNESQTDEICLSPDCSSPLLDSSMNSTRSVKPKRKRSMNAIQPPNCMQPISEPKTPYPRLVRFDPPNSVYHPHLYSYVDYRNIFNSCSNYEHSRSTTEIRFAGLNCCTGYDLPPTPVSFVPPSVSYINPSFLYDTRMQIRPPQISSFNGN